MYWVRYHFIVCVTTDFFLYTIQFIIISCKPKPHDWRRFFVILYARVAHTRCSISVTIALHWVVCIKYSEQTFQQKDIAQYNNKSVQNQYHPFIFFYKLDQFSLQFFYPFKFEFHAIRLLYLLKKKTVSYNCCTA